MNPYNQPIGDQLWRYVTCGSEIKPSPDIIIEDGADGQSAYELWLSVGNQGTLQDYLDSLIGPPGISGNVLVADRNTNFGQTFITGQLPND